MEHNQQIDAFANDINSMVARYLSEFDLPIESIIGTLEFLKNDLLNGASVEFDCDFDIDIDDTETGLGDT